MNKYEKNAKKFKEALNKAKATGEPVFTASQIKRELDFDMTESIKFMKTCDTIISISKKRAKKGEHILRLDYNGKRLIPLNKNK